MTNYQYFIGDYYSDLCIMESYISQVKFYSGTERKQMLKKQDIKHPKDGGSMLYGTTWKKYLSPTKNRTQSPWKNLYYTKVVDLHPELDSIFKEFASIYFPDFSYDQVQMNKNYPCGPHKDSKNIGESVLVCFGDYIGGETCIKFGDKDYETEVFDGKSSWIMFDGSKYLHWVRPFEGNRYSLVFFKNNKKKVKFEA